MVINCDGQNIRGLWHAEVSIDAMLEFVSITNKYQYHLSIGGIDVFFACLKSMIFFPIDTAFVSIIKYYHICIIIVSLIKTFPLS